MTIANQVRYFVRTKIIVRMMKSVGTDVVEFVFHAKIGVQAKWQT